MLGIVGNTSLIDCAVNQKYYEKQRINLIANGVARECYFSENIRDINMGPYYSTVGAAQYLINQGAKSIVAATLKAPGTDFNNQGAVELAKQNNIPGKSVTEVVPINDGAALALKLVQAAGDGGGVVLDFIPPEALKVLQGAEQQGLIDKVKWACATPCNDASIAEALGPAWNDKLGINAELNLVDSKGPDNQLYLQVQKKYAPDSAIGSFGQMGFMDALLATKALHDDQGRVHEGVRQRRLQGAQGREDGHPVQPVDVRRRRAPRERRGPDDRAAGPQVRREGEVLRHRGASEQQPRGAAERPVAPWRKDVGVDHVHQGSRGGRRCLI